MAREPIQILEVDIDYCTLDFGVGSCTAALSSSVPHKCFNTQTTCPVLELFNKTTKTIRFITPVANLPKDGTYFPLLESVSAFSTSVNLAGSNPKGGNLGKRGTFTAKLSTQAYHDRYLDKYASERVSGDAQFSGVGYKPEDYGELLGKIKARSPNFVNRPVRVIDAYLEDGAVVDKRTRHFIWTGFDGPDTNNNYEIKGKDILSLTEEDKALCPKTGEGYLASDITDTDTTVDLTPEGIGDEFYPSSGYAVIGSEIAYFERTGDTLTLTRGQKGTTAESASEGDLFQEAYVVEDLYPHRVIRDLCRDYAGVDPSFIPFSTWTAETKRWASTMRLNAIITEPTGVSDLIAELAPLGLSVWWDDVAQEIGYNVNSPVDIFETQLVYTDSDIKTVSIKANDEDRLTTIIFYTNMTDVTGSETSKSNYDRAYVVQSDVSGIYEDTKIREVYCRWLQDGRESLIQTASKRLLERFKTAPESFEITLDASDRGINLIDVLTLRTEAKQSPTGLPEDTSIQVIERTESKSGHEVKVKAQRFLYEGNFGYVMANDANDYDSATEEEKRTGAYLVMDGDETFPDGRPYYEVA